MKARSRYYNQFPTGRPAGSADLSQPPGPKTRFISRYIDAPNAALFPFGLGLSYTSFRYTGVSVSRSTIPLGEAASQRSGSLIVASVTVTNIGSVVATETVQCYVGNRGAGLEQPMRSLEGFTRVTLAPGESRKLSFPLGFNELSFVTNAGLATIEPTDYTVWIGGNSLASDSAGFHITR